MKKFLIFLISLILISIPFISLANGELSVYVKAEVSKDNGANWYNYSVNGQTLTVQPGDSLLFRAKAWNEGAANVTDLTFTAILTNSPYLEGSTAFYNADEDGNGTSYVGEIGGTITLASLASGGSESEPGGYESGTFSIQVKNDVPDQTLIEGAFTFTSGIEEIITMNKFPKFTLLSKAFAQGYTSTVRILVSNPPALPVTGTNSDLASQNQTKTNKNIIYFTATLILTGVIGFRYRYRLFK